MAKRPRSHVLGDIAVTKTSQLFVEHGWTSEVILHDYGEDLLVRVFDNDVATSKLFFLQSKSTEDVSNFRRNDGYIKYKFKPDHISMWNELRHPVIVTLYDAKTDIIYWQDVQWYLRDAALSRKEPSSFLFHDEKTLTRDKFAEFESHIAARYQVFEDVNNSSKELEDALQEHYGMGVNFGADGVIMLPNGTFTKDKEGGSNVFFFGAVASLLEELEEQHEVDVRQVIMEQVEEQLKIVNAFKDGGKLVVRNSNGKVVEEFSSLEEYQEKMVAKGLHRI